MSDLTDFVQSLKERLSIVEVVGAHVALRRMGGTLKGLCPFHNEKTPSFHVNDNRGSYHCFGCGVGGDHVEFIMNKLNMPFLDAVQYLADQAGVPMPMLGKSNSHAPGEEQAQSEASLLLEIHEKASQWYRQQLFSPQGKHARSYIQNRGLTRETIDSFRLGYAPSRGLAEYLKEEGYSLADLIKSGLVIKPEDQRAPYDRFRDRLMFPIQDRRNRVIAFGGRLLGPGDVKYLNSPETPIFHKSNHLYGLPHALPVVRTGQPFILVEGYMDVITLHQGGIKGAVAPLGTSLTEEQIKIVWRSCERPILCFDGDEAGRRAAHRAAEKCLNWMHDTKTVAFCLLPDGEDPDSYIQHQGRGSFQELINHSIPLSSMLWGMVSNQRSFQTPEDKAQVRKEIFSLTEGINDQSLRRDFRQGLLTRMEEAYAQNQQGNFSFRKRGMGGGQNVQSALLNSASKSLSEKKIALGEKILVAILINHPILIIEVGEQLMGLTCGDPLLESLRIELVDYFSLNHVVDRNQVMAHLIQKGFEKYMGELLTPTLYMQAPFAHPSSPFESVVEGWKEVWRWTQVDQGMKKDYRTALTQFKNAPDADTWQRLKILTKSLTLGSDDLQS